MFENRMIKGEGFVMMDPQDYEHMVMFRVMDHKNKKEMKKAKRNLILSFIPLAILSGLSIGSRLR